MRKPEQPTAPKVTTGGHRTAGKPVLIYRQVTLTLEAFERLKAWQRRLELAEDRPLTNGEVLDALVLAVPYP